MVYGQESEFYLFDDRGRRKHLGKTVYRIANNHHRGGQSQNRLARLRTEQIHHYVSQIEEKIRYHYSFNGQTTITRLVLSGPGLKKEQVRERLEWLTCPITVLSGLDFETVCRSFSTIILEDHKDSSLEFLNEIKEYIRTAPDRLVFGLEQIRDAYYARQLEKLYCTDRKVWIESKTTVIELDEKELKDFGGCIGLLWTAIE